jgi:murein DD-endopeptidase MepM/ murein hydrolase activator NlpD
MRLKPNWLAIASVAGGVALVTASCTDIINPRPSPVGPRVLHVEGPLPHGITYILGAPPNNDFPAGGEVPWAWSGANSLPGTIARIHATGEISLSLNPHCYDDPWPEKTNPVPISGEALSEGKVLVNPSTALDFPTWWGAAPDGGNVSYIQTADTTPIMISRHGGLGAYCGTYPPGGPYTPSEFAYYISGSTTVVIDILATTVTASLTNIQPAQPVNFSAAPINFSPAAEISWTFDTLAYNPQIEVVSCNNQPVCLYAPPRSGRMQVCMHVDQAFPVCGESLQVTVAPWINGAPPCRAKPVTSYTRISLKYDSTDLHHTEPHMGQDYADSTGTPVFSADSGKVIYAGWAGRSGYAVAVRSALPDPRGLLLDTYYYHLKSGSIVVNWNQPVSAGQFIAKVNDSGESKDGTKTSFGSHLHFEQHTQTPGKGAFPLAGFNDRKTRVQPCTF